MLTHLLEAFNAFSQQAFFWFCGCRTQASFLYTVSMYNPKNK